MALHIGPSKHDRRHTDFLGGIWEVVAALSLVSPYGTDNGGGDGEDYLKPRPPHSILDTL